VGAPRAAIFSQQAQQNGEPAQWQFGIVQGANVSGICGAKARGNWLSWISPATAVGGLAVGEPHETTCEMTAEVTALLPKERPRYLMGVGRPEQIADYVARGIDMMDCVLPTRAARHACLYTSEGRVLIKKRALHRRPAPDRSPLRLRGLQALHARLPSHLFAAGESPRPSLRPTTCPLLP